MKRVCVILAGGVGERFWPKTGPRTPKYALKQNRRTTFLSATYRRLCSIFGASDVYVITSQEHRRLVMRLLPRIKPSRVLAEPLRRNTGAAVTFASLRLKQIYGPEAVLGFFPADHVIRKERVFKSVIRRSFEFARSHDRIATIGSEPYFPSTGFGYIALGSRWVPRDLEVYNVGRFVEKPDLATAKRYLRSGRYLWNSGIFTWKIRVFECEMMRYQKTYFKRFLKTMEFKGQLRARRLRHLFQGLPATPIDRLLIEKTPHLVVFRSDFGWKDVGTWDALRELTADSGGNVIDAKGIFDSVKNSYISMASGSRVIAMGLKDLVVVQNGSDLLICDARMTQDVAKLKKRLEVISR